MQLVANVAKCRSLCRRVAKCRPGFAVRLRSRLFFGGALYSGRPARCPNRGPRIRSARSHPFRPFATSVTGAVRNPFRPTRSAPFADLRRNAMAMILSAKERLCATVAALDAEGLCRNIFPTLSHVFAFQVREPIIGTHVGQQLAGNDSHSYVACLRLTAVCCFTGRGQRSRRFFF